MNDIQAINKALSAFRTVRDRRITGYLKQGLGPTEIGGLLGVTRQRAQQLIRRIKRKANGRKRGR